MLQKKQYVPYTTAHYNQIGKCVSIYFSKGIPKKLYYALLT